MLIVVIASQLYEIGLDSPKYKTLTHVLRPACVYSVNLFEMPIPIDIALCVRFNLTRSH